MAVLNFLVGAVGIEPTTLCLKGRCSTTELHTRRRNRSTLRVRSFSSRALRSIVSPLKKFGLAGTMKIVSPAATQIFCTENNT